MAWDIKQESVEQEHPEIQVETQESAMLQYEKQEEHAELQHEEQVSVQTQQSTSNNNDTQSKYVCI